MSDAFVAVADDATAASWNPAGLIQLERPEISFVGAANIVRDEFSAFMAPGAEGDHTSSSLDLNFASVTYPLYLSPIGRNLVLSLSYQQKYNFDRNFDLRLVTTNDVSSRVTLLDFDFNQTGSLGAITPAIGIELTHNLSFGVAFNLWRNTPFSENAWDQTVTVLTETTIGPNPPMFTDHVTREKYDNLRGENWSYGLLWNITPHWNLGFRYDTSFSADVDFWTQTIGSNIIAGTEPETDRRRIRFPATFAIGVSYRHDDRLTVSTDLSSTDWNDFFITNSDGQKTSLVDGSVDENRPDFDRTWTWRIGAEYVLVPEVLGERLGALWTLRGGFTLDQEPASGGSTFDSTVVGDGKPEQFYGASLGVGLQVFNRINVDAAYQFRYGNNVNSDRIQGLPGFNEDVFQHRFILSSVIYF